MPEIILDFSNKKVNAYLTENNTMQRTETITVTGSSDYFITLKLQDGVTLVNETEGTNETGTVKIYGGDKFYLKAPLTINGSWTSEKITNCKYRFQPIVYRTEKDVYQDVIGEDLTAIVDSGTTTNLTINWLNTGSLIIHKVDANNKNIVIPNTIFDIYDSENTWIATVKTNSNGIARLDNLTVGTYKIVEKSTNESYKINTNQVEVKVDKGSTDITITNELKKGEIRIIKIDKDNKKITIPGVEFEILDSDMNVIETIITDENGEALSSKLPVINKKYFVREKKTHDIYILSDEVKEVVLEDNKITNIVFENEKKKGTISIVKADKLNEDIRLEGVLFGIYNEDEELVTTIITDVNGEGTSEELVLGTYFIKELDTGSPYYLLDDEIYRTEITQDGENMLLELYNERTDIDVTVEKRRKC